MSEQTAVTRAEIINLARELGLALARSQEIIEYREAEKKLAKDEEASRLTRIFKEAHIALARMQAQSDSTESEIAEMVARLEKADRDMKQNPLVAEYYRAGSAFNSLIYQINQLMRFFCMEPGEELQFEQKSSCCSSCEGCSSK